MAAKLKIPSLATPKPSTPDGQMELMDHLAELRMRIFRMILYVAVGMIITYNQFPQIMAILNRPVEPVVKAVGGQLITTGIADGFLLYMQVCFISGLVVAFPFVVYELWGFIAPALTPEERKPVKFLAPFSALLFFAGVGTAYAALPATYTWMASFIASVPGATLNQIAKDYVILTLKILLSFGIAFELPVVLLFLARVGIINAKIMTTYWRHATVGIAAAAAVLTPSNDPLTMLMMAIPMVGLYLLSISLVKAFEPRADGSRGLGLGTMFVVGLAPVAILGAVGFWLWRGASPATAHPATRLTTTAPSTGATPDPNQPVTVVVPAPTATPNPEAEELRQQMREIQERLERIESALNAARAAQTAPPAPPDGSDPPEAIPTP